MKGQFSLRTQALASQRRWFLVSLRSRLHVSLMSPWWLPLGEGCRSGRGRPNSCQGPQSRMPFPQPQWGCCVHAWALGRGVPWGCRAGLLLGGAAVPHGRAPSPQAPILWAAEGCGLGSWGAGVLSKQLEPGWVFSAAQLPS